MRQKLCVALAVAVLALSGARETCKQFNGLKSLAGEWSGVWNTMLVYANAYAEGVETRPAPATLIASSVDSRRDESAAVARRRRTGARVRQTPRAKREGAAELRIDLEELAFGFAPPPEARATASAKAPNPLLLPVADAEEIAGAIAGLFHSDFDAESLRSLAAGKRIELRRGSMPDELMKRGRAGVERKVARAGAKGHNRNRIVIRLDELRRVGADALRAAEAAEVWPVAEGGGGGPEAIGENEVFFVAPQPNTGLLNCDAQPRR